MIHYQGLKSWSDVYPKEKPDKEDCAHSIVDTGTLKSFCKNCDADAEFNRVTGKYEITKVKEIKE